MSDPLLDAYIDRLIEERALRRYREEASAALKHAEAARRAAFQAYQDGVARTIAERCGASPVESHVAIHGFLSIPAEAEVAL